MVRAVSREDVDDRRGGGPSGGITPGEAPVPQATPEPVGGTGPDEAAAGGTRPNSHQIAFVGGLLALVVAAILAVVVLTGGGGHRSGIAAPALGASPPTAGAGAGTATALKVVTSAAAGSLGQKSAALSVDVTLLGAGQSPPQQSASGAGAFYLSSGLGTVTLTLAGEPASQAQRIIFEGPTSYWYVAPSSSPVPGKTWVDATADNLPSERGPGVAYIELVSLLGNPGLLAKQLTLSGVSAAHIGTSTVDGAPVNRYAVSVSSHLNMSSNGYGAKTEEEVDVGTDKVIHQIVLMTKVGVNGQSYEERIVVGFSSYGLPFFVGPPPPSQLVPVAQYNTGL